MALASRVDVTALLGACRSTGRSFFAAMLQHTAAAANAVPELRQRLRVVDGQDVVVEHPQVDPAFTVAVEGGLFDFATVPFTDDPVAFDRAVANVSADRVPAEDLSAFDGRRDDVVYQSCLPWLDFTGLTHPVTGPDDSVPRIAWGRFVTEGRRTRLTVNVQVHHALVDGAHLGAFFQDLVRRCADAS